MKRIGLRAKILFSLIALFLVGFIVLGQDYIRHNGEWVLHPANMAIYKNGRLVVTANIMDETGEVLLSMNDGEVKYNDDRMIRESTLHAVGEPTSTIPGVLYYFKEQLIGYDMVNGIYGGGSDITLTLNAELCSIALDAMGEHKGTVGVYNYKTGEIICMVSTPTYDINDPPDIAGDTSGKYEGVYMNRLTGGLYVPGSVYKVITAYAAIENIGDIYEREFECNGSVVINGETITCTERHGTIDFETALAHSCNVAFAELAVELGPEIMTEYSEKAGVGERYNINGLRTTASYYNVSDADDNALAWSGIGQYTDMVTPCQYMVFMGAVANSGTAVTPHVVSELKSSSGMNQSVPNGSRSINMIEPETADELKALMRNNVTSYYSESNYAGLNLCAKTGTAEMEGEKPHSWFAGFMDDEEYPYAFVVVVENAGYGREYAAPIARTVLNALKGLDG